MPKRLLTAAALTVALGLGAAVMVAVGGEDLGTVTAYARPTLRAFDENGNPAGTVEAKALPKPPVKVAKLGKGGSIGIEMAGGRVVYLRGLDVTMAATRTCAANQKGTRQAGSSYAATDMGLGDKCEPAPAPAPKRK
jgi:hypothetical protein